MKKQYTKPTMQVYDIKMPQLLCGSADEPLGAPAYGGPVWDEDEVF